MRILLTWSLRGLVVAILSLCLFSEYYLRHSPGFIGMIVREVQAVFRDPETQWMVTACFLVYFVTFLLLRNRVGHPRHSSTWLVLLVALTLFAYARDYTGASRSLDALTLLGTITLGQAAGFWTWQHQRRGGIGLSPDTFIAFVLVALLTVAAVWHPNADGMAFLYLARDRWTGPWNNPNTFGTLMAAGFVLACGLSASLLFAPGNWRKWTGLLLLLPPLVLLGTALGRSYSRGAWVAAAAGLMFLTWRITQTLALREQLNRRQQSSQREETINTGPQPIQQDHSALSQSKSLRFLRSLFKKVVFPAAVISLSLFVLVVLNARGTDHPLARRVASMGNINDFSWRNRVAAWEGALQIIAEKPLVGHGWAGTDQIFDTFYRPAKLSEGMAIQLNDYLTLGIRLGIPGLVAFALFLVLRTSAGLRIACASTNREPDSSPGTRSQTPFLAVSLAAAALVFAVAFWFEGGLFKLATGALFFVLACCNNQQNAASGGPPGPGVYISAYER
jgi:O-antigen ligase